MTRHHIITSYSMPQVLMARPELRGEVAYVYRTLHDAIGARVEAHDVIEVLGPQPQKSREIAEKLIESRMRHMGQDATGSGSMLEAVLSGVRQAGYRDAVTTVAELDALPDGTIIRGVRSGMVCEAWTSAGVREWYRVGNEDEDTSEYLVDNEEGVFAVLYRPDTTDTTGQQVAA